jgi:hypothetical protein
VPCRVFNPEMLASPFASTLPSCPLPSRAGLQGLHPPGPANQINGPRNPLMGFGSSSEDAQAPSRCPEPLVFQKPDARCHHRTPTSSASLEVSTPSASSQLRAAASTGRACIPDRLRLQVLTTSWRFDPPRASPALFHAGSALGVTLQSFLPLTQPYAVSSAVPLMAFRPPSGSCSARESATRLSCLG